MIVVENVLKSNYPCSASSHGGDMTLDGNAGDILEVDFHFTGVTGSPSAVSVTGKWQFAPNILPGMDEDTVSQTNARKWFDVSKQMRSGRNTLSISMGTPLKTGLPILLVVRRFLAATTTFTATVRL